MIPGSKPQDAVTVTVPLQSGISDSHGRLRLSGPVRPFHAHIDHMHTPPRKSQSRMLLTAHSAIPLYLSVYILNPAQISVSEPRIHRPPSPKKAAVRRDGRKTQIAAGEVAREACETRREPVRGSVAGRGESSRCRCGSCANVSSWRCICGAISRCPGACGRRL